MFRSALALFAATLVAVAPAAAQRMSDSYEFLKAVKESNGNKVTEMLNTPGSTVINTREADSGDTALHIVSRRGDNTYLRFLLSRGAAINAQDRSGNTALMIVSGSSCGECAQTLIDAKANVNLANSSGETPLIRAVQLRNRDLADRLLKAGADPDQSDRIAGMSARDYARRDTRSPAIAKLLADAPKGGTRRAGVSGPRL
jgi:ankyrin repeat protein